MSSHLPQHRDAAAGRPTAGEAILGLTLCLVLGFLLTGTALAVAGIFRPAIVLPAGLVAATLAAVIARATLLPRPSPARSAHPAGIAALVIAAGFAAFQGAHHGEHLLSDRDPGVYNLTAGWLADHGTLVVPARPGPFADSALLVGSQGFDDEHDGRLRPQFLHGWPVLLATASWFGDLPMLVLPAVLGGLSLCCVYLFARRRVRPWAALAAVAVLATNLAVTHFARDSYSEVPVQLLVFGGLWTLLLARRSDDPGGAMLAGALLGATCLLRVDSLLLLLGIPIYAAVEWRRAVRDNRDTKARRRFLAMLALGAGAPPVLALADLILRSPAYLRSQRGSLLFTGALLAACVIGSATWCVSASRRDRRGRRARPLGRVLRRVPDAAAALVVLAILALVVVRPWVQTAHGNPPSTIAFLQRREGLAIEATRTYSELSGRWLVWYLGPIVLLGAAGWAIASRDALRRREARAAPFLLAFSATTLLYLIRPSIVPDQIWAMRRFLPVTIPGLAILGSVALDRMLDAGRGRLRIVAPAAVAIFVAASLAWSLRTLAPVVGERDQAGMRAALDKVCDAVGDDAAVVVLPGDGLDLILPQALRTRCGVPVAVSRDDTSPAGLVALSRAWSDEGRALTVVGSDRRAVASALPNGRDAATVTTSNQHILDETLAHRPDRVITETFSFSVRRNR